MWLRVRVALVSGILGGGGALAAACSSVPDIQFVDGATDGGGDGEAGGSSSSSGGDGGAPDWSCPGRAPPADAGLCCGTRLCLNCTSADCPECAQEGCAGTLDAVCCPRNPVKIDCKKYSDC